MIHCTYGIKIVVNGRCVYIAWSWSDIWIDMKQRAGAARSV